MWVRIGSGEGEGLSVKVEGERFLVGSGEEAQLMVGGEGVEPLHAYFQVTDDGVVELHALEGETYVDGRLVDAPVHIEGGEEIRIGDTVLRPSVGDPAEEVEALREAESGAEGEPAVRVETAHETVEVVPVRERRRLLEMTRRATVLAIGALALGGIAIAGVVVLSGDDEKSVAEIVGDAKGKTVLVSSDAGGRGQRTSGSGIVVDAGKGQVLTNFHVVNGGTSFQVGVDEDGRTAELVAAAPCEDLALLQVDDTDGMKSFALASQDDIAQGDDVVALGFPANASLEDNLTSTAGTVSVVKSRFRLRSPDAPELENVVQIDVALSPGNSGGPLVNKKGQLVGVNTAIVTQIAGAPIQGQGYAIGVDRVKEVLADLQAGRSRGWTGFGVAPPDRRLLRDERLPPGIVAGAPVPGTAAEQLGVTELLFTSIDGKPLEPAMTSYCSAVAGIESGATVAAEAVVKSGGRPRPVQIRFE